jgi:hypothetical protein
MMSDGADPIGSPPVEPMKDIGTEFTIAHANLRRALIQAIARRAGKPLQPISLQEGYSDIPLADLYYRKVHINRFAEVFDRLLFRWRRTQ